MNKLLLALLVGVALVNASAQQPIKKQEKTIKKNEPIVVIEKLKVIPKWTPSDDMYLEIDKLPPRYEGASPDKIIEWLNDNFPQKKDEFEKQAEYEEKKQLLMKDLGSRRYAFRVLSRPFQFSQYDAEAEAFVTNMYPIGTHITVASKSAKMGTYIASNSYGKQVEVTKYLFEHFGLYVNPNDFSNSQIASSHKVTLPIKVPLSLARNIDKSNINILLIGNIDDPIIEIVGRTGKPTIDNPSETYSLSKYISFKVKKVVVYDFLSGDIYHQEELK